MADKLGAVDGGLNGSLHGSELGLEVLGSVDRGSEDRTLGGGDGGLVSTTAALTLTLALPLTLVLARWRRATETVESLPETKQRPPWRPWQMISSVTFTDYENSLYLRTI